MREILFRAKRVDTGEWVQGWFYEDETGIPMIGPKDGVGSYAVVDRDTLGQFTGSFDINGNRIWEGDIIRLEMQLEDKNRETLVFRLRERARIRRQVPSRKSVQEGKPDRIANDLEEAANRIEELEKLTRPREREGNVPVDFRFARDESTNIMFHLLVDLLDMACHEGFNLEAVGDGLYVGGLCSDWGDNDLPQAPEKIVLRSLRSVERALQNGGTGFC